MQPGRSAGEGVASHTLLRPPGGRRRGARARHRYPMRMPRRACATAGHPLQFNGGMDDPSPPARPPSLPNIFATPVAGQRHALGVLSADVRVGTTLPRVRPLAACTCTPVGCPCWRQRARGCQRHRRCVAMLLCLRPCFYSCLDAVTDRPIRIMMTDGRTPSSILRRQRTSKMSVIMTVEPTRRH